MHLIKYMYDRRERGICFTSNENNVPFFMSDASNRGDPVDSKCAYGYVGMWAGGPIISSGKKLGHSSSASAANEYMAMSHATKAAVWLRQLLTEMDLEQYVYKPTVIFADNKTANQWVSDDKVSAGNMWILQCYHYVKEMYLEEMTTIKYVGTRHNLADLFTKGVPREVINYLTPYILGTKSIKELLATIFDEEQSKGKPESK